jgi:hypothetical protein
MGHHFFWDVGGLVVCETDSQTKRGLLVISIDLYKQMVSFIVHVYVPVNTVLRFYQILYENSQKKLFREATSYIGFKGDSFEGN